MAFPKFRRGNKAAAVENPDPTLSAESKPLDDDANDAGHGLRPTTTTQSELHDYPQGIKLVFMMFSIFISMFLVALDRLIIATAIPEITNEFHSITDIGWYGSVYMLATCAFQLMFGKLYTFWSIKLVFLASIFLFEVGSAVCGAAPSSVVFIVGRAIAGIGAAGVFSGVVVILVYAVPLHKRPMFQGLFGAIFGIASVLGPLLGGAFTTNVTWRWCFYINLPIGGVAMLVIFFVLGIPDRDTTHEPLRAKLAQLDFLGTSVFIPGTVCLLLALQWGGVEYAWSDGRIIALLVLAGVLLLGFVAVQVAFPDTATVPPRIFTQRSILAGVWVTLCIGSQMMLFVYYLPIWFQAIMGVSAVDSGIRMLPLMLAMVAASVLSGVFVARAGYYLPPMIFGTCLMAVGAGLLTTLQVDTPQAQWVGYQFLLGFGLGNTFQGPNLAAQTVLPTRDVPVGTSLMFFTQLLGGAIFVSVGQNVLNNQLLERLAAALPGFDPAALKDTGATSLTLLPEAVRRVVLNAYNEALRKVFQVGLIMVCLTVLGLVFMEWRSVKERKKAQDAAAEAERGRAEAAAAATAASAAAGEAETEAEAAERKRIDETGTDIETATDADEKVAAREADERALKKDAPASNAGEKPTAAQGAKTAS